MRPELSRRSQPVFPADSLLRFHTTPRPAIRGDDAMEELGPASERLPRISRARALKELARSPATLDAALAWLAYRYTPVSGGPVGGSFGYDWIDLTALGAILAMDAERREKCLRQVVFNVSVPSSYEDLTPSLRAGFPVGDLEAGLLAHAAGNNPLHQRNAFALAHHLFIIDPACPISDAARSALHLRAAQLTADPETPAEVRRMTSRVRLP